MTRIAAGGTAPPTFLRIPRPPYPGFPFCLPQMGPFYTRKPQRPRESSSSHRRPGSEAATQPALTCGGPEARAPRTFRRHRSSLVSSFCQAGVLALAARQPAGTGSAQIRGSIAPNRRRVRWLSASNSQHTGASKSWRIARHSKRASNTSYAMPHSANVCPRNRVRYRRSKAAMHRFVDYCHPRYPFRCCSVRRMLPDCAIPATAKGFLVTPLPRRRSRRNGQSNTA